MAYTTFLVVHLGSILFQINLGQKHNFLQNNGLDSQRFPFTKLLHYDLNKLTSPKTRVSKYSIALF